MSFRTDEQIRAAWKHVFNIKHTAFANTNWYNELFGTAHQTYLNAAWADMEPGSQFYAYNDGQVTLDGDVTQSRTWNGSSWDVSTVGHGGVIPVEKITMPLTQLTGTNQQSYFALDPPQGVKDPPNIVPVERVQDWVNFSEFGTDFTWRIFWDNGSGTGPGVEITTVALPNDWIFDPYSGSLLAGSNASNIFTPSGTLPIWVVAYRYIGSKGAIGASDLYRSENNDIDIGSETIDSFSENLSDACVWFYRVKKGTNLRAGQILAVWEAGSDFVQNTQTETLSIGDTSDLQLSVDDVGNLIRLRATAVSDDWSVRAVRILI